MDKRSFPAKHTGVCGMCGELFKPGEIITMYGKGSFVHRNCDWSYDWTPDG